MPRASRRVVPIAPVSVGCASMKAAYASSAASICPLIRYDSPSVASVQYRTGLSLSSSLWQAASTFAAALWASSTLPRRKLIDATLMP